MMAKSLIMAAALALAATAAQADPWSPPADKPMWATGVEELYDAARTVTIYHIEGRRSQRIVWLCEELGVPYNLVYRRGNVPGSGQIIQQLPIRISFAPTIHHNGRYMFESGALVTYLLDEYGGGRLRPAVDSPDYPVYLQWLHFAEGAGMGRFYKGFTLLQAEGFQQFGAGTPRPPVPLPPPDKMPKADLTTSRENLDLIEAYLQTHDYFGGAAFSGADIMMYWDWEWAARLAGIDQSKYPKFHAWAERMRQRPAYQKAMLRALPDNQPDQCRLYCVPGSNSLPGSPVKPGARP